MEQQCGPAEHTKTYLGTGAANLPFNIGCKTDALVVVRHAAVPEEGAVAATVELKKRAVKQSILQAKTTWLCASLNLHLPVLSALTDMTDVFAAFFTNGEKDSSGNTICIQHIFPDLDCLMNFMHTALSTASIPSGVLRYYLDDSGKERLFLAEELPNSKCVWLPIPAQRQSSMIQQAFRVLAEYAAGGSDVARLDDLEGFEDRNVAIKDHVGRVLKHSSMCM